MSTVSQAHCVGCGAAVTGRYCADCGEHTGPHDYSMKHFLEEVLESTAHVDGRVFASFRSLLTRPGQLTSHFLSGRRKAQMGPVQMFVVCNVLYFLNRTSQMEDGKPRCFSICHLPFDIGPDFFSGHISVPTA